MASELPDALEKLAMKAERSENEQERSLSKYFGQPDNSDDIFDAIAKPTKAEEEPRINFFKSPVSTPVKEDNRQNNSPSFAFKKGEQEEEPKIFSYFSQAPTTVDTNKDEDASEFFDQISQLASKSREPIEITSSAFSTAAQSQSVVSKPSQPIVTAESSCTVPLVRSNETAPTMPSTIPGAQHPISQNVMAPINVTNVLQPAALNKSVFTPQTNIVTASNESVEAIKTWSRAEELASNWWIPSEKVQIWLKSPTSALPENCQLSFPGLGSATELTDPIRDLLRHFDGEAAALERQTLTADMVTQDDQGIRELIKAGCYRAAANLCGRLLAACGQGFGKAGQPSKHTPYTLQLWLTRLVMLKKSSLFELAVNEVTAFGDLDSPDFYYDYYPELRSQNKQGTMVPFSFRLLAAELPAYHNRVNEAHMKLSRLLSAVRKILRLVDKLSGENSFDETERKQAATLWSHREIRVINSLVDCSIMKKDFHNAVRLLQNLISRPGHPPSPSLHSTLGRIYLQIGDVQLAQNAFNKAADLYDITQPSDAIQSLLNAGLIAIAQNAFAEALVFFQQALAIQPEDPMLVNNTAVCLLYVGRMREGMLLLEENLGTKPDSMIRDDTVLNVCTMYELESSLTAQRKLGMLRLASRWKNDNLNVASFKLQTQ